MTNEELAAKVRELEQRLEKLESKKKPKSESDSRVSETRRTFIDAYQAKFKHEYFWGAKESGLAKTWLKSISLERAKWLIGWFVQWNDPFIVKAGHPFGLLVSNTVKLEAQLARGKRYFEQVAESKLIEKETLGKEEERVEVLHHATRASEKGTNHRIGFGNGGELQGPEAAKALPGKSDRDPGGKV